MANLFEGAGAGKKLGLLYMASGFLLGIAAFFVTETAEMAMAVWVPQAQVPPTAADVALTGGVGLVVMAALAWSLIVIRRERRRQLGHGADTTGIPAGDTAGDRAW